MNSARGEVEERTFNEKCSFDNIKNRNLMGDVNNDNSRRVGKYSSFNRSNIIISETPVGC
jgi:hypothetical protein